MAKRAGFILCLVVCALGVGAGHARADTPPPPPAVIADGVQIGSVDVGGLTAGEATAAVQDAYFAPVVLHVGHHGYSVSPHHFRAALPLAPAVQTALTALADTAIPLKPTLDTKLVAKWVKTLAGKTYRAPVAGTLRLRNGRPFFSRSHPGRALRPFPTRMLLRDAVVDGTRSVIMVPLRKLTAASAKAQPVIVIHRGSNHLYLYNGVRLVRVFPVATGQAAWPTPLGPVPDRRQAEEPVVVPTDPGFVGRGCQARSARP